METTFSAKKKFATVHGRQMAFLQEGHGQDVVFLHGNPTSSFLWRNVIPHVSSVARCTAPDLIGMGDSEKIANSSDASYSFSEHRKHLDGFLDAVGIDQKIVLVVHDWGLVLGCDLARRYPERIAGLVYMEGAVRPRTWDQLSDVMRDSIRRLRGPEGEQMALEENYFVEKLLPAGILRELEPAEMEEYRRPFANAGEDRRPTLAWPRQIPIDGDPADVHEAVAQYSAWLPDSAFPKLFINAEPGNSITGKLRDFCRTWSNQSEVTVTGRHFIQEDSPDAIGNAICDWLNGTLQIKAG